MMMIKPAIAFLREHGQASLVSLGCGLMLNRIDNHIRLMSALNLAFYVGIDCAPRIEPVSPNLFINPDDMTGLLNSYYQGRPRKFWQAVKVFPETWVEELRDIHCGVVVCQRVYPDCRWEDVILSMQPKLVLQEDLHGCERQQLRGPAYVRCWEEKRHYGLQPYNPWSIFLGEYNLILWRRRDFGGNIGENNNWRWFRKLREWVFG